MTERTPDPVATDAAGDPWPAPSPAALAALDADAWARLVTHTRAACEALPEPGVEVGAVLAASVARLAGGRGRRQLTTLLAAGDAPWQALAERLVGEPDGPALLAQLTPGPPDPADGGPGGGADAAALTAALAAARQTAERDRQRLVAVRDARDDLERRLDGTRAALAAARRETDELAAQLAAAQARITTLEAAEAEHATALEQAVARERRRRDAEVRELQTELTALRRERETWRARSGAAPGGAARAAPLHPRDDPSGAGVPPEAELDGAQTDRFVPGRPSRLPRGVVPGTRPAAEALLHAGRLVLVDGYNVTRTHRAHLDLEAQRRWLVQLTANLAAARRIRPIVVWDGERAGGGRPAVAGRGVEVRFTAAGITADDELVFSVEATDEPVVVVTDDRELTARVRAAGADVLPTAAYLWVAP